MLRRRLKEVLVVHEFRPIEIRSRCSPILHQKVKEAADAAVRSLSAEVAYRLARSFEAEDKEQKSSA